MGPSIGVQFLVIPGPVLQPVGRGRGSGLFAEIAVETGRGQVSALPSNLVDGQVRAFQQFLGLEYTIGHDEFLRREAGKEMYGGPQIPCVYLQYLCQRFGLPKVGLEEDAADGVEQNGPRLGHLWFDGNFFMPSLFVGYGLFFQAGDVNVLCRYLFQIFAHIIFRFIASFPFPDTKIVFF